MNVTFLFPGQGSQVVGMGKELNESFDTARNRFSQANDILNRDIQNIIFNGPAEDLTATQNTQPALFVVESIISDILAEKGIFPSYTAGHSLGEYGALYSAGVLSFEDGLRAVARRGDLMAQAGKVSPGTMAAVIGLSKDRIAEILKDVKAGIVVTANENTPEQTVISGEIGAVGEACDLLKAGGAKRAIILPVSGAFHSPLMQGAADEFAATLEEIKFSAPKCPVIANVTAKPETDPELLKSLLLKQLVSPVRWVDSMRTLASVDHGICLETGPGSVLKGLAKKCDSSLDVVSFDSIQILAGADNGVCLEGSSGLKLKGLIK